MKATPPPFSPREFWNDRILKWENTRYPQGQRPAKTGRAASALNRSVQFRLAYAYELLAECVLGKDIVELGCGSALLAEPLIACGARSYLGVDFAHSALRSATDRVARSDYAGRIRFSIEDACEMEVIQADLSFSLGLLDWLTPGQIEALFVRCRTPYCLHSFSERKPSLSQWAHHLYVYFSYGHRTGSYVPRYYPSAEMERRVTRHYDGVVVHRHPQLSFGALLTRLPRDSGTEKGAR